MWVWYVMGPEGIFVVHPDNRTVSKDIYAYIASIVNQSMQLIVYGELKCKSRYRMPPLSYVVGAITCKERTHKFEDMAGMFYVFINKKSGSNYKI